MVVVVFSESYLHYLPCHRGGLLRQFHSYVVFCEPNDRSVPQRMFDQHFGFAPYVVCIELLQSLVAEADELLGARMPVGGTHYVWYLECFGAGAFGVCEHMQLSDVEAFDKSVCIVEAL